MANSELLSICKNKEWFHSLGEDTFGRPIVYVRAIHSGVLSEIPENSFGKPVLVHFGVSKDYDRSKFVNDLRTPSFPVQETHIEEELDVDYLESELDRLEKLCSPNILENIFFEVHDGKNAITGLSTKYPKIRKSIEKLYEDYGFDVIYESL